MLPDKVSLYGPEISAVHLQPANAGISISPIGGLTDFMLRS